VVTSKNSHNQKFEKTNKILPLFRKSPKRRLLFLMNVTIKQQPKSGKICCNKTIPHTTFLYLEMEKNNDSVYICHLSLLQSVGVDEVDTSRMELLMGVKTLPSQLLLDPCTGIAKLYFIFDHLGITMTGTFHLLCTIIDMISYCLFI
jgi:hypothetical protein